MSPTQDYCIWHILLLTNIVYVLSPVRRWKSQLSTIFFLTDVDVLQVDAASVTSSLEGQRRSGGGPGAGAGQTGRGSEDARRNGSATTRGGAGNSPAGDDLRNYAYEGLESCSGSAKLLGGFREVAHMLESWDPTGSHSNQTQATTTKTNMTKDVVAAPVRMNPCGIDMASGPDGDVTTAITYPDPLPPPISEGLPPEPVTTPLLMPVPEPPRAFKTK
ncbi:uncharacterized protein [Panulirus ornatus]|uniref:uncharacterized protein n=1 Tax=Panulirus ornatus TaxID=150431 RepID=UPI003A84E872